MSELTLPAAHPADIDMDEAGMRILSDAAGLEGQRGAAQRADAGTAQMDVDGLAFHMQAVLGDTVIMGGQPGIGAGRAIGGNHIERPLGADPMLQGGRATDD